MLEEEVAAAATAADESIMLTVAERNSGARIFYGNREYWIDTSSPGNFAEKAPYIIMRKYPNQDESKGERDARFWDHFYASQRSFRVFESDEQPYRELRAVEVFNTGSQVGRDMKVLKPSMQSACPHVLTNVATRQIVEMGDPLRRGCDQSESIGANMKSTIHRRVSRNKIDGKARKHTRRGSDGEVLKTWTQQALKVSRVMQAFRSDCVRERILRDPSSTKFLQRKHVKLLNVGRASKAPVREERDDERGIMAAYQRRIAELREEGGEPE